MDPLSATACSLESADELCARLRALQHRVDALVLRAARLEDALRWQAPSARAYRDRADDVRAAVATAGRCVDAAEAAARAARARLVAAGAPWAN